MHLQDLSPLVLWLFLASSYVSSLCVQKAKEEAKKQMHRHVPNTYNE